ncbi:hypothetical protein LGM65_14015 [Burkholderia anthina]|uniref:hypothetical protein n=1 Tax=Burkholderia anthina TaxID=179879 RepID=UPI001CF4B0A0|nr:hypothetical protein [Burkholderia anthina]MCA8091996.1 hypothetical protein [Burkholderia anthina]
MDVVVFCLKRWHEATQARNATTQRCAPVHAGGRLAAAIGRASPKDVRLPPMNGVA